jgi:hypothetical protein
MENELLFFEGKSLSCVLPSGNTVIIRETNGGDDEILSNLYDVQQGSNLPQFLTSIITTDGTLGRKPSVAEVLSYPKNDQWYLMLIQRIMNRGTELVFDWRCSQKTCKEKPAQSFTEDLSLLDGNMGDINYTPNKNQIMKYPLGALNQHQFKTSSGSLFRFDIMTGVHEKKLLEIGEKTQSKNTMLIIRNLQIYQNNDWVTLTSFSAFPSKIMTEIRKEVARVDPEFNPIVSGECSHCGKPFALSLWGMPDFFWPGEMI